MAGHEDTVLEPEARHDEDPATPPPDAAPSDRRFPRSVYGVGDEPDARFSLANERTFLTWITFGLGLISLGVALESFALNMQPDFRMAASLLLVVLGTLMPVQAWFGWQRVERALRRGTPMPSMVHGLVTGAWVVVAGVLVALGTVLR